MYSSRVLIDGRSHISPWKSLFANGKNTSKKLRNVSFILSVEVMTLTCAVSKADFISGLQLLPFRMSMGPPSLPDELPIDEVPTDDILNKFWVQLAGPDSEQISEDQVLTSNSDYWRYLEGYLLLTAFCTIAISHWRRPRCNVGQL